MHSPSSYILSVLLPMIHRAYRSLALPYLILFRWVSCRIPLITSLLDWCITVSSFCSLFAMYILTALLRFLHIGYLFFLCGFSLPFLPWIWYNGMSLNLLNNLLEKGNCCVHLRYSGHVLDRIVLLILSFCHCLLNIF